MAAQHEGSDLRAHRQAHNPRTVVSAPPGARMVAVSMDLGATRTTLTYDQPQAKQLSSALEDRLQHVERESVRWRRRGTLQ